MLSRDHVLALMRERVHHPAAIRELLQVLKIPRDERTTFKRHIKALVSSGELIQIRGHRYGLPEKMDLYVGRLQTHPAGYGFVTPERPLDSGGDIYISGPLMNEAMHGDRVVVRIERVKEGGRAEGRIIRILERANQWIVGRYDRDENGMGYVVPFDRRVLMDIFIPPGQEGGADPGLMVSVELTRWPTSTPRSSSASGVCPTRIRTNRSPKRSVSGPPSPTATFGAAPISAACRRSPSTGSTR